MMDQILQHNWMRQIIQGTVNAPSHVRHQILYFFITEIRKRMNKIISTTTSSLWSTYSTISSDFNVCLVSERQGSQRHRWRLSNDSTKW